MSKVEIVILICVCVLPIMAFLFVKPKKKKSKEVEKQPVQEFVMEKKEEKQEEPAVKEKPRDILRSQDFSSADFSDYLKKKRGSISMPKRLDAESDFSEDFASYRRRRLKKPESPKTVAEQVVDLPAEIKALMISGVFDRRDF